MSHPGAFNGMTGHPDSPNGLLLWAFLKEKAAGKYLLCLTIYDRVSECQDSPTFPIGISDALTLRLVSFVNHSDIRWCSVSPFLLGTHSSTTSLLILVLSYRLSILLLIVGLLLLAPSQF